MRSDSLPAQSQIEPDACPETAREIGVRFERASGARSDGESRPSPSGACAHAARRAMICVESVWPWDAGWRQLSVGSGVSVTVWEGITISARWASRRNECVSAKWLPCLAAMVFFARIVLTTIRLHSNNL